MSSLSVPWAIVAAAVLVALSILGASVIAPHRISAAPNGAYRVNAVTGDVQICALIFGGCRSLAVQ
jgi:hypothetical protein